MGTISGLVGEAISNKALIGDSRETVVKEEQSHRREVTAASRPRGGRSELDPREARQEARRGREKSSGEGRQGRVDSTPPTGNPGPSQPLLPLTWGGEESWAWHAQDWVNHQS